MSGFPEETKKRLLFAAGYLVDCGSAVSVLPPTSEERQNPNSTEYNLYSANGQRICTYGRRLVAFKLFGHACSHDMIIADVVRPILGMDFFKDGDGKRCLIDPLKRCLIDRITGQEFKVNSCVSSMFSLSPCNEHRYRAADNGNPAMSMHNGDEEYDQLWKDFPEITEVSLSKVVTMTTPLHIVTDGPPIVTPCRKLHGDKKTQVEEQLLQWERDKVIERCESSWASPIHAVMKSDGSWRVCGDFRRINTVTQLDRYPLPTLSSFNERLVGCTVFSKVDLKQAFQQVCVEESSQEKTAIITTLGLFKFLRMPFGLKNAAQCFQRNVHQLLNDLPFATFIYMDDLIVGSVDKEQHLLDLRCLFQRLKDTGLLLNRKKCELGRASLTFLGHVVNAHGISIPPERVEAITRFPVPKTPKELERFLGVCAFFRRFVRHASAKMAPLSKLKNITRQKDFETAWLPEHDVAFSNIKDAMASATLLIHPSPTAQTEIWCDASNIAVGAVLVQLQQGIWRPLSFWSKLLNKAQCGYSATDRELLAVSYAVDKFRSYLEGQPVVVRTDHKALVGSLTKKADTARPIPRRHLLKIAQFVNKLHYLEGERNGVADALSRIRLQPKNSAVNSIDNHADLSTSPLMGDTLPQESSPEAVQDEGLVDPTFLVYLRRQRDLQTRQLSAPTFIPACSSCASSSPVMTTCQSTTDYNSSVRACSAIFSPDPPKVTSLPTSREFRAAQENDSALQKWIVHHKASTSRFRPELVKCEGGTAVWSDVAVTPARVLVPVEFQRVVFDSLHQLAHPGVKAGMSLIKRSYWWQGIGCDVSKWTKACEACQKAKVHVHTKSLLERLPAPSKRFSHIHIDLVGPLNPACEGKNILLTVIDRWTGWPDAFPMTMHGDAANAKACAKVLIRRWIAMWGVPDVITSDRGPQFVSDLWIEMCQLMGIARNATTSYYPQHNGKIERMHRCLKNSLRARLLGRPNWLTELPWVMLGLRAAANLETGVSPSLLVTGQQPALPGQLVVERSNIDNASSFGRELSSAMANQRFVENPWHDKKSRARVPDDLWTAKRVLVRADKVQPSLAPKYTGPYRVLRRWSKCFRLQLDNKSDSVSIDRLRPFYEDETPRSASHETVNSSAADNVLPALVSRPGRNLRPPRRLGYD